MLPPSVRAYNPDRQLFFDLLAEAQNKHSEIPDRTLCTS